MNKTLLVLLLICNIGVFASKDFDVTFNQHNEYTYELIFELGDYKINTELIDEVTYSNIDFKGSVATKLKGFAELPYLNSSIQLPSDKNVSLEIIEDEYVDYQLEYPLIPSKGVIYRNEDPASIPLEISPSSMRDEWYPQEIAIATDPYIIRDVRGTSVYVYPFRYNAVQNILRVYKNITVQLIENGTPAINPLVAESTKIFKEMDAVYNSVFINYNQTKDDLTLGEYGDILIICTSRDSDAILPFVEWKMEKGYNVSVEVVETGTNVKTTIEDAYEDNNDILYVQLVGDWADIKCDLLSGYAPMDPQLGCVVGADNHADIFIGRFSANSANEVTVQVDKSINYEKYPDLEGTWYTGALGIGSDEGSTNGDDSEMDKEHIQVIWDDKLDPFTYEDHYISYAPGASTTDVSSAINSGIGMINYCGHGSSTAWVTSGFSNSNVNTLDNDNELPIIFSVACVNGAFHNSTDCFAEAWLNNDEGGAVAALMSTINQPWQPPMRGQDYFMDIIIGGYDYDDYTDQSGINTTEQRTTLGSVIYNGMVLMINESNGTSDWETAKTWTLFGDVSLQPRTDTPDDITLSNNTVLVGVPFATTITGANGNIEGAMVCLSQDGVYYKAITDETGSVSIENDLTPGIATLVVTGFNLETIYEEVTVVPPDGPWILVNSSDVNDFNGNNNGQADYGETVKLDIEIMNVGDDPATDISATITTEDPYLTINSDSFDYGDVSSGDAIIGVEAFEIEITENAPDLYSAIINIEFSDESKVLWTGNFSVQLHAPILNFNDYTIDDLSGNGDGKIDPGETAEITIGIMNEGSSSAFNVIGEIMCSDPYITIDEGSQEYYDIDGDSFEQKTFIITASEDTPVGHAVTFNFEIGADMNISGMGSFVEVIGHIPVLIIDLDENSNSADKIVLALESNGIVGEILTNIPDDLSLYTSVFVCLGVYSDNYVLSSEEGQQFATYLNGGGNLYMEGGDTWAFNSQTAVHTMFNISGDSDGDSDMGTVEGQDGTFAEGMSFNYSGDNNWMDNISATGSAFEFLNNSSPSYGTGVAFEGDNYKTIGCSHEFGGLDDGDSPSTKLELMAQYLDFFGLIQLGAVANFTADETEICENDIVSFSDLSSGDIVSWQWEFPGGDPEFSDEQNPVISYDAEGVYDVILTISDEDGENTYTNNDYIIVNICTNISEYKDLNINVHPNPSNGKFNVYLYSEFSDDINIKVLNSLGSVVHEEVYPSIMGSFNTTLDLGELHKGLYFLVIENYQGRTVNRIIIR